MLSGRAVATIGLSLALACAVSALGPALADPQGWSDDLRLTWAGQWSYTSYNNAKNVACDNLGNVHVVWTEVGYYFSDVYYMCRPAGESDWTEPVIDQDNGIITLQLRAERSGTGEGRIYTITITATDESGNSSQAQVNIIVPHDKRNK